MGPRSGLNHFEDSKIFDWFTLKPKLNRFGSTRERRRDFVGLLTGSVIMKILSLK